MISHSQKAMKIAVSAVFFTFSVFFSPSAFETAAFNPTAFPNPNADTKTCTGAERESAVSASSSILAMNMESTKLYKELISRLSIRGIPVARTSRLTFSVPILFSMLYPLLWLPKSLFPCSLYGQDIRRTRRNS